MKLCINLSKICLEYCGLFFSGHGVYNLFNPSLVLIVHLHPCWPCSSRVDKTLVTDLETVNEWRLCFDTRQAVIIMHVVDSFVRDYCQRCSKSI